MVCYKPMVKFIGDFFYKYSPFMYSYWYSCLHFPDTTTLTDRCHLLPHFPTLLRGATFSTPAFSTPAFLTVPRFPLPRFQLPRSKYIWKYEYSWCTYMQMTAWLLSAETVSFWPMSSRCKKNFCKVLANSERANCFILHSFRNGIPFLELCKKWNF